MSGVLCPIEAHTTSHLYNSLSIRASFDSQSETPKAADTISTINMADSVQELIDIPRDFVKDGTLFINRCTKRKNLRGKIDDFADFYDS